MHDELQCVVRVNILSTIGDHFKSRTQCELVYVIPGVEFIYCMQFVKLPSTTYDGLNFGRERQTGTLGTIRNLQAMLTSTRG